MKKLILLLVALIILINITGTYKEDYYIIPEDSIRIRIVPNSNNIKDQYVKKQVKTNLEIELLNDLKNVQTIETSRRIIIKNIKNYQETIKEVLKNENTNQTFQIEYGNHYFPEKKYKGVKYKEGNYESLLVTLGKGQGDNWWCVLFPPLCSLEVEENNKEKIEYSLYVKEMFDKYIN